MNIIIRIICCLVITGNLMAQNSYELIWSDEFDYVGLPDPVKWSYDIGDGCPNVCGWGNNELEYYTEGRLENARVEDGNLIITAIKEDFGTKNYSSARLVTRDKGDWTYGRIEVRADLPSGKGTWPAIWMLPTDWSYGGWPDSGEIDVMEHVGYEPDQIYGTVHTKAFNHAIGTQKGGDIVIADCEEEFHTYAIEWSHSKIDFFVDENKYYSFSKIAGSDTWPFDQRFHLILNIAVGGNWGGVQGVAKDIFPQEMKVDYVRVYQLISNVNKKGGTGELMLFPNPVKSRRFTIQTDTPYQDEIKIYDVSGNQIDYQMYINEESVEVHLGNESSQMLLVSLVDNTGVVSSGKVFVY
ncbi:MAG: family 16 glycosylhydrolase [Reichenbachiella sp.]|uniref:family 16 glycosylhydrolase n=1 Tax=Reichenbachiella sp. TaxID=2184521 RepID=UPI00326671BA